MAYKSLSQFIEVLEKAGELLRIKEYVNPDLEITEITDRISKQANGGKALLFENTGYDFPLLINAFGSEKRMALSLGVNNLDDIGTEIEKLFKKITTPKNSIIEKLKMLPELGKIAAFMPKNISGRGASQEIIHKNPDITKLPVLTCWPSDGGKFITLPMVITKDPLTGIRNVGMYRMQIFDKNLTAMHWHKHKVGARHFNEYKKLGKKMPIAVALGGDPAITYSATAPLPDNMDEFMLAGFLRKQKVKLVRAITQDIEVPADADIIIEGYINPEEDFIYEGPFGDHTGFYSLADYFPKFHITCITHRKDAVYPTTIVGIPPQEDAYIGKATERIFLAPMRLTMVPELKDMNLPHYGVAHNLTIVSIDKTFSGQAIKVASALWGAGQMMFNKVLIVVDKEVNVHNYSEVYDAFINNVTVDSDIHYSMGPLDILDHSASKYAFGSKMCIDATCKFPEELSNRENTTAKPENNEKLKEDLKNRIFGIEAVQFADEKEKILFLSAKKSNKDYINELQLQLKNTAGLDEIKMIILFDKEVNINDLASCVWLATGNIDPKRDSYFMNNFVLIDATRKTLDNDNFERNWPNILVMDDATVEAIDKKWERLNIGAFIQSPSVYYRPLKMNDGAIVKNNE
ncbi:MAG: menaquinone biosynthesis decarboxylase [Bacteroidales bacterium]|nr:menaquinone biosynthesis decarboxylase [Bacteroidales bacterium]